MGVRYGQNFGGIQVKFQRARFRVALGDFVILAAVW